MNDFEKQKLGMYESVLSLLAENKDIVSSVRSFGSNISKLRKAMDEIRRVDRELSSQILDKTIQNAKAKDELIIYLEPVTLALFNFARKTNDLSLKEKTRLTKSQFIRMLDKELTDKAEAIRIMALANAPHLRKFGLKHSDIDTLAEKLNSFRSTLENKVTSLISSSTVVFLSDLFARADEYIGNMDAFVEALEDEFEEFYDEYLEARDLSNQDQVKALMALEEEDEMEE